MTLGLRDALITALRAQSPAELCQIVAAGLAGPSVVLSRVWLQEDDHSLRLTGSAGAPTGGGNYRRLNGEFSHLHRGSGKIAQISESGQPMVVRGLRGDEDWLANPGWVSRQGIRSFLGFPIRTGAQALGVLAVFDRTVPSAETLDDLRFVSDFLAARVSELRERGQASGIGPQAPVADPHAVVAAAAPAIITRAELREFERHTLEAALARTNGKIFGSNGAAVLLGMKPTTLASRIKALGIR